MANIYDYARNLQTGQTLGSIADDIEARQRQIRQDAMTAETQGLQNQLNRMRLSDLMRQENLRAGAAEAVRNRQPRITQEANPAYQSLAQLKDIATAGPPEMQNPLMSELQGGVPGQSNLVYPGEGFNAETFQQQPETIERRQVPSASQARYEYYLNNDPIEAEKIKKETLAAALDLSKISNNPQVGADYYYNVIGEKLETKPQIAAGTVFPVVTPEGQTLGYNVADESGKLTFREAKTITPEYKQRERPSGNKTIFEQSLDGGKTWEKVSEGPRYKPATGTGGGQGTEKDLPAGVQDKISSKLEMYNDWRTLKDTFKPEFMPKIPAKSVAEFKINMNKILGGNQDAIDWWTNFFDARNLLLKDRSGAAITEPEFKRFEQGAIAANSNYQSVINYLDKSVKKYKSNVDGYVNTNKKNHPQGVQSLMDAYGYSVEASQPQQSKTGNQIAPAGMQAKLPSGKIVTSDGKGGWK